MIRNLMVYKVLKALAALLAANFLPDPSKKQDPLLPFSPSFGGKTVEELDTRRTRAQAVTRIKAHPKVLKKRPGRNKR